MIRLSKGTCELYRDRVIIYGLNGKHISAFKEKLKKIKEWSVEFKKHSKNRSTEISNRFHGWVTFLARETGNARDVIYVMVLNKAIEIVADGGEPYPYAIVDGIAYPYRTSGRTNKEMMTACWAVQLLAQDINPDLVLPEEEL